MELFADGTSFLYEYLIIYGRGLGSERLPTVIGRPIHLDLGGGSDEKSTQIPGSYARIGNGNDSLIKPGYEDRADVLFLTVSQILPQNNEAIAREIITTQVGLSAKVFFNVLIKNNLASISYNRCILSRRWVPQEIFNSTRLHHVVFNLLRSHYTLEVWDGVSILHQYYSRFPRQTCWIR